MLKFWSIVIVMVLVACDNSPKPANRTPAERAARAEEKLSVPPVPRTYAVGDNQLVVVDVPVKDSEHFVDKQRCFIFRDTEFKQSTMSCGQQPDVVLGN